jgi:hypothetical protein
MSDETRKVYRELTDAEKAAVRAIKEAGDSLIAAINEGCGDGRMAALGRTNAEQAVMWAVKGATG